MNDGSRGGSGLTSSTASATATMTITEIVPGNSGESGEEGCGVVVGGEGSVILRLNQGPRVTWEEDVVDNEGLGRKSSKRCCIFSKKREWDESSSESESDGGMGGGDSRPIARPKKAGAVPDFQRFHA